MATSATRDPSSAGVFGAGRAVAAQSDGGSGSSLAMDFASRSNGMRHAAQEVLRALLLRRAQQLARLALLDDPAAVDEDHSIRHLAREAHFVRYDDHRHAVVREHAHDGEHFADKLRVEP